jgi:hypothetical protein
MLVPLVHLINACVHWDQEFGHMSRRTRSGGLEVRKSLLVLRKEWSGRCRD